MVKNWCNVLSMEGVTVCAHHQECLVTFARGGLILFTVCGHHLECRVTFARGGHHIVTVCDHHPECHVTFARGGPHIIFKWCICTTQKNLESSAHNSLYYQLLTATDTRMITKGVPTNNQRALGSGPCLLWWGLDKPRPMLPTASWVRVQCVRKDLYKVVEGPNTRHIVLSMITGSYCRRRRRLPIFGPDETKFASHLIFLSLYTKSP